MAEMKTKASNASVKNFLNGIANARRREDALVILEMMKAVTRKKPTMWGPSIVGFDRYHYKYDSGHEGDMCMIGFSPRSQALTLYIMPGFARRPDLMRKLGTYRTSVSCLYIKKLEDVDLRVLKQLVTEAYRYVKEKYG